MADSEKVGGEIRRVLDSSAPPPTIDRLLEPIGGAVSPDSPFYIRRSCDDEIEDSIRASESVVLVRGPRQIGKTSLLGQGALLAKNLGWRHATTDFQMVGSSQLCDQDKFAKLLAATLAKQLDFKYDFGSEWLDAFGPNMNLGNFLRALIEDSEKPFVWFMDEADRIFSAPFASDFFGHVRSWHNARATDPSGPWSRFTVVISYATEARLFIRDLNQSPFNVGRNIGIHNFTEAEVAHLNQRYGSPLKREADLEALNFMVNGQPFLVQRALQHLARTDEYFPTFQLDSDQDDGPFGDHLKRLLVLVSQDAQILMAVSRAMDGMPIQDDDLASNLVSAGVLRETAGRTEIACDLYERYLARHLT